MARLSVAFPNARMSPADAALRADVYYSALCDLATDEWRSAVVEAIRECRFYPTVSELRGFLGNPAAPVNPAGYLPPSSMTPEERAAEEERRRESIAAGLARIREVAGVAQEKPTPRGGAFKRAVSPQPMTDAQWEARREELKRMADNAAQARAKLKRQAVGKSSGATK